MAKRKSTKANEPVIETVENNDVIDTEISVVDDVIDTDEVSEPIIEQSVITKEENESVKEETEEKIDDAKNEQHKKECNCKREIHSSKSSHMIGFVWNGQTYDN